MTFKHRLANGIVRFIMALTMRIDIQGLDRIPMNAGAILLSNHTTNFEGPLYYVLLHPRRATALAKTELWEKPLTRFFMTAWDIIPLARGRVDRDALKQAKQALGQGYILGIAPEGTRSKSGQLRDGQPGAALLAMETGVPLYPLAQWGLTDLADNIKKLKKTDVHIRVGEPFRVRMPAEGRPTRDALREATSQMMYRIAALLPETHRGKFQDPESAPRTHLEEPS